MSPSLSLYLEPSTALGGREKLAARGSCRQTGFCRGEGREWNIVGEGTESDSMNPGWQSWECWSPSGGRQLGKLVGVWAELGVG